MVRHREPGDGEGQGNKAQSKAMTSFSAVLRSAPSLRPLPPPTTGHCVGACHLILTCTLSCHASKPVNNSSNLHTLTLHSGIPLVVERGSRRPPSREPLHTPNQDQVPRPIAPWYVHGSRVIPVVSNLLPLQPIHLKQTSSTRPSTSSAPTLSSATSRSRAPPIASSSSSSSSSQTASRSSAQQRPCPLRLRRPSFSTPSPWTTSLSLATPTSRSTPITHHQVAGQMLVSSHAGPRPRVACIDVTFPQSTCEGTSRKYGKSSRHDWWRNCTQTGRANPASGGCRSRRGGS